ncbi:MAG: TIGR00730 family Rossman fold protein [Puniceicoccales bacterium]|jgi:uncharacterized protein (TIGR00730 family)|nr:TIGR00730 family Rossman fold protein [Puniceicoccales bacterium]
MNVLTYYNDKNFCGSADARTLRILSEYLGPQQRLSQYNVNHTIVFFGSARICSPENLNNHDGNPCFLSAKHAEKAAMYYEKARLLAYKITQWTSQLSENSRPYLITGGGPGIMEAGNRGAQEAGGISIGMAIALPSEQEINAYCTPGASMKFHYFFMRKYWLLFKTRAFIAFPGGIGTLDELFEILTLMQTHKVRKFPILLFGSEFWDKVINFQILIDWGVMSPKDVELFRIFDDVDEASKYLQSILTPDYLANASNR